MKFPVVITFRHCQKTEAVEQYISKRAERLERFCREVISCHVLVEEPHHHKLHGMLYKVRINTKVPGKEIVVGRAPTEHMAHKDIYVALRDAFDATRRQLEDYMRERRRDIKHHERKLEGRVARLMPFDDYGFLETDDGREVYFHKNSVLNGRFDQLEQNSTVSFCIETGDKGPQASTVLLKSKKVKHSLQNAAA